MTTSGVPLVLAKGDPRLAEPSAYGAKAAGLAVLPADWTLSFVAVAVGAVGGGDDVALRRALQPQLASIGVCGDGVLVRSSAVGEQLSVRGAMDSRRVPQNAGDILEAMRRIERAAPAHLRPGLGFVIQRWAPGAALGHLSNERRVSHDRRSWLCEAELPVAAEERTFRFRTDSSVDDHGDLSCGSFGELPGVLRGVARRLVGQPSRMHLEWVWDGDRVWVVQCDQDVVAEGSPPGSAWRGPPASAVDSPLSSFREAATADTWFPKVNHVRTLRELELPHGDVYYLADEALIAELASGQIPSELDHDLELLIARPLVVRTDVRARTDHPVILSKRTDTCLSRNDLETFLVDTAREYVTSGHAPGEIAFLAHRFRLAESGAFSYARPSSPIVRIDATWGLPDSLLFHPHDSYEVDVEKARVDRYLRCKSDYVDVDELGQWRSRPSGRPWDWRRVLTDDDATEIAAMSRRLAEHLGERVETMFFVGVGADGERWQLPWFFAADERRVAEVEAAPGYYVGERVTITDFGDLADVERRVLEEPSRRLTLILKPGVDLLRSKKFIDEVAALALRRSFPVELEGSALSHAYYLLDEAGVAIRSVNPWRAPQRRQTFGKLVRDLVPVKIERHGELADVYQASPRELIPLVKAKLVEEALEYFWADGEEGSVEELADVLELLRTAARVHGVAFERIEDVAQAKRMERGGFDAGIVLVETRAARDGMTVEVSPGPSRRLVPNGPAQLRARLDTRRRPVRLPSRRVILPLVPPSGWQAGRAYIQTLDAEEELVLTYGKDEILVQLRPRVVGPGDNQLRLAGFE